MKNKKVTWKDNSADVTEYFKTNVPGNPKQSERTTNEVSHTPTPWDIHSSFETREIHQLKDEHGEETIAILDIGKESLNQANAAFIVKAVNTYEADQAELARLRECHEELLQALKELSSELYAVTNWQRENNKATEVVLLGRDACLNRARQAIAKAEGR